MGNPLNVVRPTVLVLAMVACLGMTGCKILSPIPIPQGDQRIAQELIDSENPQVEIGRPNAPLDFVGQVMGIPGKILLWDRRIDRHKISEGTILAMADYLEANNLPHVKVRANQYAPLKDWGRLKRNKTVAWPYRYTLGLASLAGETLIPGRVFGGDHFNPFTQTIHLYSDIPAVALHEGAHAKDFTRRKYQGTYAAAYTILPLWHETIATEDVFAYVEAKQDPELIAEANRILYPAYGTYVGGAIGNVVPANVTPIYYASVIAGHVNGRMLNRKLPKSPPTALSPIKTQVVSHDLAKPAQRAETAVQQASVSGTPAAKFEQ